MLFLWTVVLQSILILFLILCSFGILTLVCSSAFKIQTRQLLEKEALLLGGGLPVSRWKEQLLGVIVQLSRIHNLEMAMVVRVDPDRDIEDNGKFCFTYTEAHHKSVDTFLEEFLTNRDDTIELELAMPKIDYQEEEGGPKVWYRRPTVGQCWKEDCGGSVVLEMDSHLKFHRCKSCNMKRVAHKGGDDSSLPVSLELTNNRDKAAIPGRPAPKRIKLSDIKDDIRAGFGGDKAIATPNGDGADREAEPLATATVLTTQGSIMMQESSDTVVRCSETPPPSENHNIMQINSFLENANEEPSCISEGGGEGTSMPIQVMSNNQENEEVEEMEQKPVINHQTGKKQIIYPSPLLNLEVDPPLFCRICGSRVVAEKDAMMEVSYQCSEKTCKKRYGQVKNKRGGPRGRPKRMAALKSELLRTNDLGVIPFGRPKRGAAAMSRTEGAESSDWSYTPPIGQDGIRRCRLCNHYVRPQQGKVGVRRWRCVRQTCRRWYGLVDPPIDGEAHHEIPEDSEPLDLDMDGNPLPPPGIEPIVGPDGQLIYPTPKPPPGLKSKNRNRATGAKTKESKKKQITAGSRVQASISRITGANRPVGEVKRCNVCNSEVRSQSLGEKKQRRRWRCINMKCRRWYSALSDLELQDFQKAAGQPVNIIERPPNGQDTPGPGGVTPVGTPAPQIRQPAQVRHKQTAHQMHDSVTQVVVSQPSIPNTPQPQLQQQLQQHQVQGQSGRPTQGLLHYLPPVPSVPGVPVAAQFSTPNSWQNVNTQNLQTQLQAQLGNLGNVGNLANMRAACSWQPTQNYATVTDYPGITNFETSTAWVSASPTVTFDVSSGAGSQILNFVAQSGQLDAHKAAQEAARRQQQQ